MMYRVHLSLPAAEVVAPALDCPVSIAVAEAMGDCCKKCCD